MTIYYVGPGGSNSNNGLTWATRKLTINGAEDIPVAAGDTVYVGPGVYREAWVIDVAASSGNPITFIGDVTGENTDGIGGVVRITGSDNDQTPTRANAIAGTGKHFRTYRGFSVDSSTNVMVNMFGNTNNMIWEDCFFYALDKRALVITGTGTNNTVRRCIFWGTTANASDGITYNGGTDHNSGNLVENCLFHGGPDGITISDVAGITIKNCTFINNYQNGVDIDTAIGTANPIIINNCLFINCNTGVEAFATGEIIEDYNGFSGCQTERTNVNIGSNSVSFMYVPNYPILSRGFRLFSTFQEPSMDYAQYQRAGTDESTEDLYGITRPTTAAKKHWGAFQPANYQRETGTTRTGGVSMVLNDAGRVQFKVPVTSVSTTFSVYVHRQANYAGTNPQMVIRQPGVADNTTTDAGASGQFNQLTTTLTPSTNTKFVMVEFVSNNTATSGSYKVFWDDFTVS